MVSLILQMTFCCLIILFLLLGKFFIYSQKCQNVLPSLQGFIARTECLYNIELHIASKRNKFKNHFKKWEKLIPLSNITIVFHY